jgi:lysophospholipase L1-like esterase
MKKTPISLTLLTLIAASTIAYSQNNAKAPAGPLAPIEDTPGLPRVLLIGDSISIGYTLPVRELLKGKANVHRPNANCGPTINGLKNLDAWLATGGADKKWDVIHFNWGLHDLKYMGPDGQNLADPKLPTSKPQVSLADYEKNLRDLVTRLKKTGAKLIWRNTTPIPEGAKGRVPGDDVKYNEVAAKIMTENQIPIDDLYGFAKPRLAEIQNKSDVHFSTAGSQKLAEQVVAAIQKELAKQ